MILSLDDAVKDMNDWLAGDGKDSLHMLDWLKLYVPKLRDTYGIQVDRIMIGSHVLHPQAAAWNWKYEYLEKEDTFRELSIEKMKFLDLYKTLHPLEPFVRMERFPKLQFIRHRNTDEEIPSGGMTDLLVNGNYTDLYGIPSRYHGRFQTGITWATTQPGGFTNDEILFFEQTKSLLRMTLVLLTNNLVTQTLLTTYLGTDPGLRVHNGSVHRGDGVTVRSVIWFSDVRGFTSLSSRLDRDSVIDLINDVFDVTETVLKKHGGEILKFMGDGVLAVIKEGTSGGDKAEKEDEGCLVCQQATLAAREFQERLNEKSDDRIKRGLPGMEVGIGLHYGDCSYGNVGATTRLDFTVIGPSVNLASRVEGLCSKLKACVLATDNFVKRNNPNDYAWKFRGKHSLKGVIGEVPVYELAGTCCDDDCVHGDSSH